MEDRLHRHQTRSPAILLQLPVRDGDAAAAAVRVLGVAEIDGAILFEIAVEHHVHQSGLALCVDFRDAGDRRRQFASARDDAQAAGPLGHQHAAVRQEGERPGMHQPAGHRLDFQLAGGGGEMRHRPSGARRQQQGGQQQKIAHARLHRSRVNYGGSWRVPTGLGLVLFRLVRGHREYGQAAHGDEDQTEHQRHTEQAAFIADDIADDVSARDAD